MDSDSATTAAWVQAIGTIVALAVAIAAPLLQVYFQDRDERRQDVTSAAYIVAKAAEIFANTQLNCSSFEAAQAFVYGRVWPARLRSLLLFIDRVPFEKLGSFVLVRLLVDIRGHLAAIDSMFATMSERSEARAFELLYPGFRESILQAARDGNGCAKTFDEHAARILNIPLVRVPIPEQPRDVVEQQG